MSPDAGTLTALAGRYRRFAVEEARGVSGVYERLALAAADDADVLAFLAGLPTERQQPNLFLAAVRHLHGVPADGAERNAVVRARAEALRVLMLARTTQTNEPACCAVLLPVLARLPQPLALIEVGASAGLCLLPERYGYDYDGRTLLPDGNAAAPVFACTTSGAVPLPETLPQVCWRRGLDLNPLDQNDPDDAAWLETLVWPGQEARLQRLRAAVAVARTEPPIVVRGDLLADLETLMAEAPRHATLVVFHTAVLAYVGDRAARERFAAAMRAARAGLFPLSVDGRPVAWTGPHGQSVEWFGDWFGDRIAD